MSTKPKRDTLAKLREELIDRVFCELQRAEELHPGWPEDIFEQLAIIGEEFGELQQAALQAKHDNRSRKHIETEAVQVAAMALRFLFELPRKGVR